MPARINGLLVQRGRSDGTIWAATAGGVYGTTIPMAKLTRRTLLVIMNQR